MTYDIKKLLVFSTRVSIGYIPYAGPFLSNVIAEIQNDIMLGQFAEQIRELQSVIGEKIEYKKA